MPWTCETLLKSSAFPSGEEGLQGPFEEWLVHYSAEIQQTNVFKAGIELYFGDFKQMSEVGYRRAEAPLCRSGAGTRSRSKRAVCLL